MNHELKMCLKAEAREILHTTENEIVIPLLGNLNFPDDQDRTPLNSLRRIWYNMNWTYAQLIEKWVQQDGIQVKNQLPRKGEMVFERMPE